MATSKSQTKRRKKPLASEGLSIDSSALSKNTITPEEVASLEKAAAAFAPIVKRAEELVTAKPKLPIITAIAIAQDEASMDRAAQAVGEGDMDFVQSIPLVGSYSRIEYIWRVYYRGDVPKKLAFEQLIQWWPHSDPDDLNPAYLRFWEEAREFYGSTIYDSKSRLPFGNRNSSIPVYRGIVDKDEAPGIAWTLDPDVAMKFARGAGYRRPMAGGRVIMGNVKVKSIIAYLCGRNEQEVIVNPMNVDYYRD